MKINIRYFDIGFGNKEDKNFRSEDYEECDLITIKADHYPNFEEVEKFLEEYMKLLNCTGINSITEVEEREVLWIYDKKEVDEWDILTMTPLQNIWCYEDICSGEQGFVIADNEEDAIQKLSDVHPEIREELKAENVYLFKSDGKCSGDVYITRC